MPATATKPAVPFASRVTHAYDARTGIVHIALDDDEAGYFVDVVADGILFTRITTRECHKVTVGEGAVCDCKSAIYRGHCRHQTAAVRMIEDGEV